jgi:hypothetical protein
MSASAISFFTRPQPPSPAVRRAKAKARARAKAKAKANLTKAEQAAIRGYLHADATTRKAILLDQATKRQKAKLLARRKWRKAYQAHYRAMAAMATVFI